MITQEHIIDTNKDRSPEGGGYVTMEMFTLSMDKISAKLDMIFQQGKENAELIEALAESCAREFKRINDRFDAMDARFDAMEAKFKASKTYMYMMDSKD